jgi:hypothetical protein
VLGEKVIPLAPGAFGLFVSKASLGTGQVQSYGLGRRLEAVRKCRGLSKASSKVNDASPKIAVDPNTYQVRADSKACSHSQDKRASHVRERARQGWRADVRAEGRLPQFGDPAA